MDELVYLDKVRWEQFVLIYFNNRGNKTDKYNAIMQDLLDEVGLSHYSDNTVQGYVNLMIQMDNKKLVFKVIDIKKWLFAKLKHSL